MLKKNTKRISAWLMMLVLILSLWGQNGTTSKVTVNAEGTDVTDVADVMKYDVSIGNGVRFWLHNKTAVDGTEGTEVYLSYKVKSFTSAGMMQGVGGAGYYDRIFPYDGGGYAKTYRTDANYMLAQGASYLIKMTVTATGFDYEVNRTLADGTVEELSFTHTNGTGTDTMKYLGLWIYDTSEKIGCNFELTDVCCYTKDGKDLGLEAIADGAVTMTSMDTEVTDPVPEGKGYGVSVEGGQKFCLSNETALDGEIGTELYLSYTVESFTSGGSQQGLISTEDNSRDYPYDNGGKMKHTYAGKDYLLTEGASYLIKMTITENGFDYIIKRTLVDGTEESLFLMNAAGKGTGTMKYMGLWINSETEKTPMTFKLKDVYCFDANGADLGITVSYNVNTRITGKKVHVTDVVPEGNGYGVSVKGGDKFYLNNETALDGEVGTELYLSYTVESFTSGGSQQGLISTEDNSRGYPYDNGGKMKHTYAGTDYLLTEGASYLIKMTITENGFDYIIKRTLVDGTEESLSLTNATGKGTDTMKYMGLWINSETEKTPMTFKLKDVYCFDANGADLGITVSCNMNTRITGKKVHVTDVVPEGNGCGVSMEGGNRFYLCNETALDGEIGTELYLSYTVESFTSGGSQQGLISTEDNSRDYPYDNGGKMKHTYAGTDYLLTEGASYLIKMTITENGFDYIIKRTLSDGTEESLSLTNATGDATDTMKHMGLWINSETDKTLMTFKLKDIYFFDANGKNLGTVVSNSGFVLFTGIQPQAKNTTMDYYYDVQVVEKKYIALGNKLPTDSSKITIEYKVVSAEYLAHQVGIGLTNNLSTRFPYTFGSMKYTKYDEPTNLAYMMTPGAEYIITIEKDVNSYAVTMQRTLNSEVSKTKLGGLSGTYDSTNEFAFIWLAEIYEVETLSFHLTNFKIYDEAGNDLGVQCNQSASIMRRGEQDYAKCEGSYYCAETGNMMSLSVDQKIYFTVNGTAKEGTYKILSEDMTASFTDSEDAYTYYGTQIIDSDGNVYERLHYYKVTFVTGTDEDIQMQELSAATGYVASCPEEPTLAGYEFKGWFMSDGTEFDFEQIVTESVTLYAKWSGDGGITFTPIGTDAVFEHMNVYLYLGAGVVAVAALLAAGAILIYRKKKRGADKC